MNFEQHKNFISIHKYTVNAGNKLLCELNFGSLDSPNEFIPIDSITKFCKDKLKRYTNNTTVECSAIATFEQTGCDLLLEEVFKRPIAEITDKNLLNFKNISFLDDQKWKNTKFSYEELSKNVTRRNHDFKNNVISTERVDEITFTYDESSILFVVDAECSICQENCETGQEVCRMPCSHVFHRRCIEKWFKPRKSSSSQVEAGTSSNRVEGRNVRHYTTAYSTIRSDITRNISSDYNVNDRESRFSISNRNAVSRNRLETSVYSFRFHQINVNTTEESGRENVHRPLSNDGSDLIADRSSSYSSDSDQSEVEIRRRGALLGSSHIIRNNESFRGTRNTPSTETLLGSSLGGRANGSLHGTRTDLLYTNRNNETVGQNRHTPYRTYLSNVNRNNEPTEENRRSLISRINSSNVNRSNESTREILYRLLDGSLLSDLGRRIDSFLDDSSSDDLDSDFFDSDEFDSDFEFPLHDIERYVPGVPKYQCPNCRYNCC